MSASTRASGSGAGAGHGVPVALLCLALHAASPRAEVLYDGSLGTLPVDQGWAYLPDPLFGDATQTQTGTAVVLDTTTTRTDKAGYFAHLPPTFIHPGLPVLDRNSGYAVSLDVQVLEEFHVSEDRAGFSVIVLSSDLLGLELAFWEDEVWVQEDEPLFTHGEGAPVDTTVEMARYDIHVAGDDYSVLREGVLVLEGPLRDYSSFGAPYDVADFLFLGDDTSSAAAIAELRLVQACTAADLVPVGDSLRLGLADDELVFEVLGTEHAAGYQLFRDDAASTAGLSLHLQGDSPVLLDAASRHDGQTWYYLVRSADACGRVLEE